jgi:SAM-dependent methyltransferase
MHPLSLTKTSFAFQGFNETKCDSNLGLLYHPQFRPAAIGAMIKAKCMTTWTDGYVSDIEYTNYFYPEIAPTWLDYVCLQQGIRPPTAAVEGANYCELGCGQGVGTAILAASNPKMRFWGVDFNPAQIANARRLAEEGKLANITYLDKSFQQCVTEEAGNLPQFEYIVLHGIYSWVSAENRSFIAKFIDRHLKPGGIVYVSYNCLPGWSPTAPLQRLFWEYAKLHPDRSDLQAKAALDFSRQLSDAKAGYFTGNPSVAARLDQLGESNAQYLAHEYFNGNWNPMYHADVAKEMEAARLNYIGSATLTENIDRISVIGKMLPLIQEARNPVWRETLRDFSRNQRFRRDVFVRGASPMKAVEHSQSLAKIRVALLVDRRSAVQTFMTPTGEIKGNPEIYGPILDALAQRPHSIGELVALPSLAGKSGPAIAEAVALFISSRQAHPLRSAADRGEVGEQRLNLAIAQRIRHGEVLSHIAVPQAGTGISASYVDLVAILAMAEGMKLDPHAVAKFGWEIMHRNGQRMLKDKVKLQSPDDNIKELQAHLEHVCERKLPVWKALGVI